VTALKTRPPTGRVPWPLVLVEGPEKSGKSYAIAVLSASERVGQTYWLDLGEGSADEYGAVPGARYLVVDHNGTWADIYGAVEAIHTEAARANAAGEPPVVLAIDSMTAEWELLKDWATNRARKRRGVSDPNAEVKVAMDLWNDANARHAKLMRLLMTFPGIAIMTARGKPIAMIGDDGKPVEGRKEYKVEGQKSLAFDASCWVRLDRDEPGQVVGLRSVHAGIRPGRDRPKDLPDDWTLEWLVFDALRCDPTGSHARKLTEIRPGDDAPESPRFTALALAIDSAPDLEALRKQWEQIGPALADQEISDAEAQRAGALVATRKVQLQSASTGEASA
jgi:hypothetical protein